MSGIWFLPQLRGRLDPQTAAYYDSLRELEQRLEMLALECRAPQPPRETDEDCLDLADYIIIDMN